MVRDWRGRCIQKKGVRQKGVEMETDLNSVGAPILQLVDANEDENIVVK